MPAKRTLRHIVTGQTLLELEPRASVMDAAKRMAERDVGAALVQDKGRLVGIFTERDILNRIVAVGKDPKNTPVGEVMTSPMACCRRDTRLAECKSVMSQKRIRHLPVVEEGKLYGIISAWDILASEVSDQQATIEYLHEYLYGRR